ncbi:exonuclease domain-containing protein [Sphingobacterium sp. Mn56C]|uniref:3'-5' exonuclease n=1 Tax=Sphingobacterium sp. Mn56C TaxID=3395261 RepID=UPI003BC6254B
MKDYLLFLDTETSGIPLRWDRSYMDDSNWPHVLQLAWKLYDIDRREVKQFNAYIYEPEVSIDATATQVHGITIDFLRTHGLRRKETLRNLAYIIKKYDPIIIGHFIELDTLVLSAEFYRSGLPNPFVGRALFCTMLNSKNYVVNPSIKFLRLPQLYEFLFKTELTKHHEAAHDAWVTAQCFFELWDRQEITEETLDEQRLSFNRKFDFLQIPINKKTS